MGFVALDPELFAGATESVADQEAVRHNRIDEVIESTELRKFYRLETEYDLTGAPTAIDIGSAESLLAMLFAAGG